MQIVNFTPVSALIGGTLIGLSTVLFMFFNGRIIGISGILRGFSFPILRLMRGKKQIITYEFLWRVVFILGMFLGAIVVGFYLPEKTVLPRVAMASHYLLLVVAGTLIGVGSALGHGCTSGHSICGLSLRLKGSALATMLFIFVGFITNSIMRYLFDVWTWQQ